MEAYSRQAAESDLAIAVAQTDAKGDRKARPHQQVDPDMYLRVVETSDEGIVVNGAKAHTTQSAVSDEIIVIPTRAMTEEDADYSLAFAIPPKTPGLKFIVRPIDELEGNTSAILSRQDYEFETLTVFDHVRIPWIASSCFVSTNSQVLSLSSSRRSIDSPPYRTAQPHPASIWGRPALPREVNGILDAPHVREDLVTMIGFKELMRMSAIAAAQTHLVDEEVAVPNPLYTNIGKLYSNQNFPLILGALVDIAGGIIATLPSAEDMGNEEEARDIFKYMRGAEEGKKRTKVLQLAKELAASSFAGYMMTLMGHAEGLSRPASLLCSGTTTSRNLGDW